MRVRKSSLTFAFALTALAAPAGSVSSAVRADDQQSSNGATTAEAPPIRGPHSIAALIAEFQALGGAPTPDGMRAALTSDDIPQILAAIHLVHASKDRTAFDLVKNLEFHESPDVRLAAACYLAVMGDEDALARLRSVAEVPFEVILAYDPAAQRRLIEAVRTIAETGHEGYCYQLTFLLLNGVWSARGSAAAALGSFHELTDASLELTWLSSLDVLESALTHQDQRIRNDAPAFAQGLLASALAQDMITDRIFERFEGVQSAAGDAGFDELAAQFGLAIEHLEGCERTKSINEPPGVADDPRKLASATALQIIEALYEGRVREISSVLDIENGVFEGMPVRDWIAEMELQFPPGFEVDPANKPWTNEQWVVRRPTPTYMDVEFSIDLLNRVSENWEAISMSFEVQWWGFGWHITALDRFVDYEIISDLPGEFGSILALPPVLEEPFAPLLNLYMLMSGREVEDFASDLHDDGVFRRQSKDEFLRTFKQRFAAPDGSNPIVIPAEYLITARSDDVIEGQMQVVALVEGMGKPVRVNYAFRVVRVDGRWVLHAWQDIGRV